MGREWAPPGLACRRATVQERTWGTGGGGKKRQQEEETASFIEKACQPRWGRRVRGLAGVLHRILIPDSLLLVLPIVSSAVFLWVRPSHIAVGFGSSFQLLSRGFSFGHGGGEGCCWKREKEGGRSGKARVADQTAGTTERVSTALSILSVGSTR